MRRFEAQLFHAAAQLVGHLFRATGRRHRRRHEKILVAFDQFFNPVIVRLGAGEAQAADVFRRDVDAGGKKNLLLDPFFFEIVEAKFHIVAGDLARRDLAVAPIHLGIVDVGMAMRRAALRIAGIELMRPFGWCCDFCPRRTFAA